MPGPDVKAKHRIQLKRGRCNQERELSSFSNSTGHEEEQVQKKDAEKRSYAILDSTSRYWQEKT